MKKILFLGSLLLCAAAASFAQASTKVSNIANKMTNPATMDWSKLITSDYVFTQGPVLDLSNIDKGAVIQIRYIPDGMPQSASAPSLTWGPDEYNIKIAKSKESRVVAIKSYGGGIAMILLAGDIPGNFMETMALGSRTVTIKGRVTEYNVKAISK